MKQHAILEQITDDALDPIERAFLKGYEESINTQECAECEMVVNNEARIEKEGLLFCSMNCLSEFEENAGRK